MRLASKLDISSEESNETFAKYRQDELSTQKANHQIFTNWMNKQGSEEDAYVLMRYALIQAGLKLFAKEILDYDRPSTSLRRAFTDDFMPQLSAMLTEEDLEHLVSEMGIPLQVDGERVEESCSDETPSRMGILEILSTWLMAQKSQEEAHDALTTALKRLGLNLVADLIKSTKILSLFRSPNLRSFEPQSTRGTKSKSAESTVIGPNPLCISTLPTPNPVATTVSTPDPKCFVALDSKLLSAQEVLERESVSSSGSESESKPGPSFSELELRLISKIALTNAINNLYLESPNSFAICKDCGYPLSYPVCGKK